MSLFRIWPGTKIIKNWKIILLLSIFNIAFILTIFPHNNYPYLYHVDEWFHIARAKQIVLGSELDWHTGQFFKLGMERGWHAILAAIQFLFKPNITQWIYLPSIIHSISIISVYYFVSKLYGKKDALISALLIAILPSNVTMGGPVFLIPLNLSLIFIPIALIFAFELTNLKKIYNQIFLILSTTFLLYAHPPSAVVLLSILGIYFLLHLFSKKEESKRKAKFLCISLITSIVLALPNYVSFLVQEGSQTFTFEFWVQLQSIPLIYGVIPTIFFIIGFYYTTKKADKKTWSLIITSIVLLINILLFSIMKTNYILPYIRTHIPLFLLMSIIASKGYMKIIDFFKSKKNLGMVFLIIALIATAAIAVPRNLNTDYYQLIDENDYESFLWIKGNTSLDSKVLCDPLKARALAPVAERQVYAVMPFGPVEEKLILVNNANRFLSNNCTNTSFLIENNIDIVYTRNACQNENLTEIKDNIYIFNRE